MDADLGPRTGEAGGEMVRILIIDDLPMVRQMMAEMLRDDAYEVVEAENGRDGIAKMREAPVDLVITDIIMPEMEGLETVLTLKKDYPDLRIIAMSGGGRAANYDFLAAAAKLGASRTLHKPFTRRELLEIVAECLASDPA
jgi:CheY-like chemotaxis protein